MSLEMKVPTEVKDYEKIIDELQSHRREIEKLHIDLANLAPPSAQKTKGRIKKIKKVL